ncbi:MAG: hypothetical protein HUU28_06755 [Planctomycetaceae bacterium]|nr:hypothetical protein [Planctomycetaceae bacterium]
MKLFLAIAALALAVTATATATVRLGSSGSILFGDPARTGEQKTTVKVSYIDSNGKKQEKTITATTPLTPDDTPETKLAKVKEKLDEELNKDSNKVNGQPLASTVGGGNGMIVTPAPDPQQGGFTSAKIEKISTDDTKTGEKDVITSPSMPALAQVECLGDITGSDGSGASVFEIETNLGTVTVNLTAGMRRPVLLRALASGLEAQGATCWVDTDRMVLFVYVSGGEGQVSAIGVGSTDEGLTARVGVLSGSGI